MKKKTEYLRQKITEPSRITNPTNQKVITNKKCMNNHINKNYIKVYKMSMRTWFLFRMIGTLCLLAYLNPANYSKETFYISS